MQAPLFVPDLCDDTADNAFYVMLKPSADLADTLWRFPESARRRPPHLLHMTVQPLGRRDRITQADLETICASLSRVRYAPFLLQFDRVTGGESMALCGGGMANFVAQDFRLTIVDALAGQSRPLPKYHLHPHMTLDYRGGRPGRLLDQPVGWLVDEFVLVESVHGETRHIEWGRWPLRAD